MTTETQILRICPWTHTHGQPKDMNTVDKSRHYIESHGICPPCHEIVRAEIAERKRA